MRSRQGRERTLGSKLSEMWRAERGHAPDALGQTQTHQDSAPFHEAAGRVTKARKMPKKAVYRRIILTKQMTNDNVMPSMRKKYTGRPPLSKTFRHPWED